MTPAQQAALEALVGRPLTAEELAALEGPLAARDTTAIAAALPPRPTIGEVTREWFASWAAGNDMRAKIEDYANTPGHLLRASSLALIDVLRSPTSGINFAVPANVMLLDAWVQAEQITRQQADELLALATKWTPIDEFEIRRIFWSDAGEWLA